MSRSQPLFGRPWTPEDDAVIRARYPNERTLTIAQALGRSVRAVYVRAQVLEVKKTEAYIPTTRWQKGHVPASKGRPFAPGNTAWNQGRRYGSQTGRMTMLARYAAGYRPPTEKPLGSLRLRTDRGTTYLERKFSMTGTNQSQRWRAVHRLVWEAQHGPTPPGHRVVFRAGMHTIEVEEITLDRLELVTHAQLLERNTVLRYPAELQAVIRQRAGLMRRIRNRARSTTA